MKKSYFDRPISDAIKGILLIFMFAHHFFGFPEYYVAGVSLPWLAAVSALFRWPLKICVSGFAFLTGYFFCLSSHRSYRRVFRKLRDFLLSYWMVYIPFLVLALALGCWTFTPAEVVQEAFGLGGEVMAFCWYVFFYCCTMLLLPLAAKLLTGSFWGDVLIQLLLPLVAFTAISQLLPGSFPGEVAGTLLEWYPCVAAGLLFANYDLFQKVLEPLGRNFASTWGKVLLWLTLAGGVCLARAFWPRTMLPSPSIHGSWLDVKLNMDVLYAPVFLYAMKNLLELVKNVKIFPILEKIGKESMLMWFLHGVFFNCYAQYTQPLLYLPRLACLVLPWGLALCYGAARLLRLPLRRLTGKQ